MTEKISQANPNIAPPPAGNFDELEHLAKSPTSTEAAATNPETDPDPLEHFRVDPANYPIFSRQVELDPHWGNNTAHELGIDYTLSRYVTSTAELIATLDGTSIEYAKEHEITPPDHVIYLDKSARPVSWLVNKMWSAFSQEQRPDHSYLSIDRLTWFRATGVNVDQNGYLVDAGDHYRRATINDFDINKLPADTFAKIRSLYLPDGIESEDPDEIMSTPSRLNGKNILIVDEVGNSGATLGIAERLLRAAIPEANSVRGTYFWRPGFKSGPIGTEPQMLSAPVWYNENESTGRGIGELNPKYYEQRYAEHPNSRTRAQKYGSIALAAYINLDTERNQASRELMREITQMRHDLDNGHILVAPPANYSDERTDALIAQQGLHFGPALDTSPTNYLNVRKAIIARS